LESIVQLFDTRADLDYFCSLIMRLRVIRDLTSVEQQAILAYIILFNMSDDEAVSHIAKVSSQRPVLKNSVPELAKPDLS
jgi:hypothetical protein